MALLALLFSLLFLFPSQNIDASETSKVTILYDLGAPENSVGVIDGVLYESGDLYKNYQIMNFEPNALILEDMQTRDSLVLPGNELPEEEDVLKDAKHLFAVKQIRKIYEAQVHFLHDQKEYASNIESLIEFGYLPDGFQDEVKQGYHFRIVDSKKEFNRDPEFQAVAEPEGGEESGLYYFFVDQLGIIRFGQTLYGASWGPSWDYTDHGLRSISHYIGLEEQTK